MLGYEVDFGHMEVINLISGLKLSEKAIGYFATTLLIHQNDDLMKLIVNGVRNDLTRGDANVKALAMSCIANTGFKQLSEVVRPDVYVVFTEALKKFEPFHFLSRYREQQVQTVDGSQHVFGRQKTRRALSESSSQSYT